MPEKDNRELRKLIAKLLCFVIMLFEMCAILSGVALMYGSVIVIFPNKRELAMDFHQTPIMCQTLSAVDILYGLNPQLPEPPCAWKSCFEWCLGSPPGCMQIWVQARQNASALRLRDCGPTDDTQCSALNETLTHARDCNNAECKDITGIYNCTIIVSVKPNPPMPDTVVVKNECRKIDPAFKCVGPNMGERGNEPRVCNEGDTCGKSMIGIYSCTHGNCIDLIHPSNCGPYRCEIMRIDQCERKCTKLNMTERNVVLFSKERLISTTCASVETDVTAQQLESINTDQEWLNKEKALFIFCTYVDFVGDNMSGIAAKDCFNATLGSVDLITDAHDYRDILEIHQLLAEEADNDTSKWLIGPESNLTVMNYTQLRINPEGCVNNLIDECRHFFETHAHDGFDGMTKDRYPCYYTDYTDEYVIGKFLPTRTLTHLLVASLIPGVLLIVSCTCLFLCSRSVGVNKEGQVIITLLREEGEEFHPQPDMTEI